MEAGGVLDRLLDSYAPRAAILVRLAIAFALLVDMIVAIASTKIPILIGHGFWGFAAPATRTGFWAMAHEARTDLSMLLGCAFLLVVGASPESPSLARSFVRATADGLDDPVRTAFPALHRRYRRAPQ